MCEISKENRFAKAHSHISPHFLIPPFKPDMVKPETFGQPKLSGSKSLGLLLLTSLKPHTFDIRAQSADENEGESFPLFPRQERIISMGRCNDEGRRRTGQGPAISLRDKCCDRQIPLGPVLSLSFSSLCSCLLGHEDKINSVLDGFFHASPVQVSTLLVEPCFSTPS